MQGGDGLLTDNATGCNKLLGGPRQEATAVGQERRELGAVRPGARWPLSIIGRQLGEIDGSVVGEDLLENTILR